MRRRATDRSPSERMPGASVMLVEMLGMLALGALLALAFCASDAHAGQAAATVHFTQHDPLRGTSRYQAALERLQYAGPLPAQWSVQTPTDQTTGVLESLTYRSVGPNAWRADVEYQVYVAGRVFAAGFER